MDAVTFESEYDSKIVRYTEFGHAVESLVEQLFRSESMPVHAVSMRAKSKSSATKKAIQVDSSFAAVEDLHDMVGVRVITYFADQVDLIGKKIEQNFTVNKVLSSDKRLLLDPDRFGYLSLHFVLELSESRLSLPEYSRYRGLKFEVQIRSILQHAWAEIEHDLGYKSAGVVPREVRRRFSRLAGLLELADEEFSSIRGQVSDYATDVSSALEGGGDAGIDQDSIFAFVGLDLQIKALDSEIAHRYGVPLVSISSELAGMRAEELIRLGYTTVHELRIAVARLRHIVADVAVEWLCRPDPDSDGSDDRAKYPRLTSGIGLFYLYLYESATRNGEYGFQDDGFGIDDVEASSFIELCNRFV